MTKKSYPDTIQFCHATWEGDPTVGIGKLTIRVGDPEGGDGPLIDLTVLAKEDHRQCVEEFRERLADAFEVIGDGRPCVEFDFEIPGRDW